MPSFPLRPHLRGLRPVVHGGAAQLRARGIDPELVDDFSATLLPIPVPDVVRRAIETADPRAYPDPGCTELKAQLARRHGVRSERVLCANGSVALIRAVARACLSGSDRALVVGPTFGEYAAAVEVVGASVVELRTTSASEVVAAIDESQPALVFVCNPNNPTGHLWSERDLEAMAAKAPLVVDEAYSGFLQPEPEPACGPGRLVLRSLTKDHALAGLRVGYALGEPDLLAAIALVLDPWAVSAPAQAAAVAALTTPSVYPAAIRALWEERARLIRGMEKLGLPVQAGAAPYFLVEVGDASRVTCELLTHGILVRDCSSFGLPSHIRVSPQLPDAGDRLLSALGGSPLPAPRQTGRIIMVLGGARSGKSHRAEQLAAQLGEGRVTYIATAEVRDTEMETRVADHRRSRPSAWETLEEPFAAADAVARASNPTVLLDCLTLLATNHLLGESSAMAELERVIQAARSRPGTLVVVTNEVGSGIVPSGALSRRFRDLQGTLNKTLADAADRVELVVAGQVLPLKAD